MVSEKNTKTQALKTFQLFKNCAVPFNFEQCDATRVPRHAPPYCQAGRLYRESAQYKDGEYLRDLSKLNRDPGQVRS